MIIEAFRFKKNFSIRKINHALGMAGIQKLNINIQNTERYLKFHTMMLMIVCVGI